MTSQIKHHIWARTASWQTPGNGSWISTLIRWIATLAVVASALPSTALADPELLQLPEPPVLAPGAALLADPQGGYYLDATAADDLAVYLDQCRGYTQSARIVVKSNNDIWRAEVRARLAASELRHTAELGRRWEWWEVALLAGGAMVVGAAAGGVAGALISF